jgi:hypothetical protein
VARSHRGSPTASRVCKRRWQCRQASGTSIKDRVQTLGGNRQPPVARTAWLPARLAPTLAAAALFALPAGEAIGRGRLPLRRALLSECEPRLQPRDPSGLSGNLPFSSGRLLTQSINLSLQTLVGIIALLFVRSRHDSHGTRIGSRCTAP